MFSIGGDGPCAAWVARRTENAMSTGKTSVPAVLATLLLISCVAPAATFEVPLTGLIGQYGDVEPIPGDVNLSGCVDDDDLSLLLANWNIGNPWGGPPYTDPTGDGQINDDDLALLLANWGCADGAAQAPPGEAPVIVEETWIIDPEPDLNGDGCVDDDDLSLLLANWGAGGFDDCPPGYACLDLNRDRLINDDDLTLLLANWGCADDAVPVPEPAALVLLCAAALAIPRRRRA